METLIGSLGGGLLGAVIKIIAGLLMVWRQNKQEERHERMQLADKFHKFRAEVGPDSNSEFVSTTRRVLAFSICWTFCAICLLWAIWPGYPIVTTGGDRGTAINLLLFNFSLNRDLGITLTTGAIVWQLIPFMSMILMTYFTPNIAKFK